MPRIYVASLSDYNAGILHGVWIDLGDDIADAEYVHEQINEMLANSPTTRQYGDVAEEWAIHDDEDWGGLNISEYADIDKLVDIAELMESYDADAVAAHIGHVGWDYWSVGQFEEDYAGCFESKEDWAEQFLDDTGQLGEMSGFARQYFDFESYAHDAELGGDVYFHEDGWATIYVFWNH